MTDAPRGHVHPISSLIRESNRIFFEMGFTLVDGPLIESEWYNFDALNVAKDHPARDMQDTFYVENAPGHVLRTHVSPIQIRAMEAAMQRGEQPPFRWVYSGKVFRNEATDITHEAEFFQIEWLVVGTDITLAHLKGMLRHFFRELFKGADIDVRFRPSYFPFTEPSVEIDLRAVGANVPEKLRGRWIELMGAGMVHPTVLKNGGLDPAVYQGFAGGMGLDRLAMLRWGIDDIRLMHSADLRFINQF